MKICFFTKDHEVGNLANALVGVDSSVLNSKEGIREFLGRQAKDKVLLFIDLDEGSLASELNREYLDQKNIIRILMTEESSLNQLKKHQEGHESASGYIKKPLTHEIISGLVNDFELSDYVEKNNLTHEGDIVTKEDIDLTFVGVKKPNFKPPTRSNIIRPKNLGEEDNTETILQENDGKTMSKIEKRMLTQKGIVAGVWNETYECPSNSNIQKKFDAIFGIEKKVIEGPKIEDLPVDQQSEYDISINFSDDLSDEQEIKKEDLANLINTNTGSSITIEGLAEKKEDHKLTEKVEPQMRLKVGHVEDGFKFLGGDPSDEKNWEEVKK